MKINTQDYNDVTIVELQGELDSEFSEMFESTIVTIVAERKIGLVVDMSNVGFIDSSGLEQLLWARDYCSENNCQLRLAGIEENCGKILEVTRLENEFDRYENLSEAVKSFA